MPTVVDEFLAEKEIRKITVSNKSKTVGHVGDSSYGVRQGNPLHFSFESEVGSERDQMDLHLIKSSVLEGGK